MWHQRAYMYVQVLAVNADPDCVQGSLLRSRGSYEIWGKPLRQRVDEGAAGAAALLTNSSSSSSSSSTATAAPPSPAIAVVLFNKGELAANVTLHVGGSGDYGSSDFYPAGIDGPYNVRCPPPPFLPCGDTTGIGRCLRVGISDGVHAGARFAAATGYRDIAYWTVHHVGATNGCGHAAAEARAVVLVVQ